LRMRPIVEADQASVDYVRGNADRIT